VNRHRSVCLRGIGEEYALTRAPRLRWPGQGVTEVQDPIAFAAPAGVSLATRSRQRGLAAGMRSYKFHRPVVRDSVRGSSNQALKRTAARSGVPLSMGLAAA
jgi:hypothetical protein